MATYDGLHPINVLGKYNMHLVINCPGLELNPDHLVVGSITQSVRCDRPCSENALFNMLKDERDLEG